MTGKRFAIFFSFLFLLAVAIYFFSTPHGSEIPLTGIVDGNEVIVSPQITGRIINLTVDEGSAVKKGDLIAALDPKELEASLAAAQPRPPQANVRSLEDSVGAQQAALDLAGANLKQVDVRQNQISTTLAQL